MKLVRKSRDRNIERSETAKVVGLGESLKRKLKIIDSKIINSKVVTWKDLRSLKGRISNIGKIWSIWSKRSRNLMINLKRWIRYFSNWTEHTFLSLIRKRVWKLHKLEENISKLQKFLLDEEKVLEQINQLRSCKEEFKKIERQDVKYRKDLKHMKQKIKKLNDKLEKVMKIIYELSE